MTDDDIERAEYLCENAPRAEPQHGGRCTPLVCSECEAEWPLFDSDTPHRCKAWVEWEEAARVLLPLTLAALREEREERDLELRQAAETVALLRATEVERDEAKAALKPSENEVAWLERELEQLKEGRRVKLRSTAEEREWLAANKTVTSVSVNAYTLMLDLAESLEADIAHWRGEEHEQRARADRAEADLAKVTAERDSVKESAAILAVVAKDAIEREKQMKLEVIEADEESFKCGMIAAEVGCLVANAPHDAVRALANRYEEAVELVKKVRERIVKDSSLDGKFDDLIGLMTKVGKK